MLPLLLLFSQDQKILELMLRKKEEERATKDHNDLRTAASASSAASAGGKPKIENPFTFQQRKVNRLLLKCHRGR